MLTSGKKVEINRLSTNTSSGNLLIFYTNLIKKMKISSYNRLIITDRILED